MLRLLLFVAALDLLIAPLGATVFLISDGPPGATEGGMCDDAPIDAPAFACQPAPSPGRAGAIFPVTDVDTQADPSAAKGDDVVFNFAPTFAVSDSVTTGLGIMLLGLAGIASGRRTVGRSRRRG
ncbi:hypothetical protein Q4F19_05905 [Sphingomonas sp. BIUV-7]|uniref:Uncharacterized protein n=1 Tax=Sphingomonas natans TaxID=3063330 RepID=A0ABT8Y852_9SPHN|nr:hypothetical protein [Sphingomonas sp. BIUV-7]MDO6413909.1 hypothetical protein [Sphingomonas sp. BIUV-7]